MGHARQSLNRLRCFKCLLVGSTYSFIMSIMRNARGYPTLLRHPVLDGIAFPVETVLPYPVFAYRVEQKGDWWIVRVHSTGEAVYQGPGPVEVFVGKDIF